MLRHMPSSLFAEWLAYYRIEPFGVYRDNLHAGLIAATVRNVNRVSELSPVSQPGDFVLFRDKPAGPSNDNALLMARFEVLARRGFQIEIK